MIIASSGSLVLRDKKAGYHGKQSSKS